MTCQNANNGHLTMLDAAGRQVKEEGTSLSCKCYPVPGPAKQDAKQEIFKAKSRALKAPGPLSDSASVDMCFYAKMLTFQSGPVWSCLVLSGHQSGPCYKSCPVVHGDQKNSKYLNFKGGQEGPGHDLNFR